MKNTCDCDELAPEDRASTPCPVCTIEPPAPGQLVEADVIGTPGTFRVVAGPREPEAGKAWIRETGLHLRAGMVPFLIEWPVVDLRAVAS